MSFFETLSIYNSSDGNIIGDTIARELNYQIGAPVLVINESVSKNEQKLLVDLLQAQGFNVLIYRMDTELGAAGISEQEYEVKRHIFRRFIASASMSSLLVCITKRGVNPKILDNLMLRIFRPNLCCIYDFRDQGYKPILTQLVTIRCGKPNPYPRYPDHLHSHNKFRSNSNVYRQLVPKLMARFYGDWGYDVALVGSHVEHFALYVKCGIIPTVYEMKDPILSLADLTRVINHASSVDSHSRVHFEPMNLKNGYLKLCHTFWILLAQASLAKVERIVLWGAAPSYYLMDKEIGLLKNKFKFEAVDVRDMGRNYIDVRKIDYDEELLKSYPNTLIHDDIYSSKSTFVSDRINWFNQMAKKPGNKGLIYVLKFSNKWADKAKYKISGSFLPLPQMYSTDEIRIMLFNDGNTTILECDKISTLQQTFAFLDLNSQQYILSRYLYDRSNRVSAESLPKERIIDAMFSLDDHTTEDTINILTAARRTGKIMFCSRPFMKTKGSKKHNDIIVDREVVLKSNKLCVVSHSTILRYTDLPYFPFITEDETTKNFVLCSTYKYLEPSDVSCPLFAKSLHGLCSRWGFGFDMHKLNIVKRRTMLNLCLDVKVEIYNNDLFAEKDFKIGKDISFKKGEMIEFSGHLVAFLYLERAWKLTVINIKEWLVHSTLVVQMDVRDLHMLRELEIPYKKVKKGELFHTKRDYFMSCWYFYQMTKLDITDIESFIRALPDS